MTKPAIAELPQEEVRRARILEGATEVFLAYGYQRTTMEDIAQAAEISRPALYQHFRNKTDIYRALAADFLQRFLKTAEHSLNGAGELAARLDRALGGTLDMMLEIEASAHGAEIIDMRGSLAADIVAEGRVRMQSLFETTIAVEAERLGRPRAVAVAIASMILDALDGMRLRNPPLEEQRATLSAYIRVAVSALEA